MLSEDLKNVSAAIGQMADKVSPNEWDFLRGVKANLDSIASGVENLENATLQDEEVS